MVKVRSKLVYPLLLGLAAVSVDVDRSFGQTTETGQVPVEVPPQAPSAPLAPIATIADEPKSIDPSELLSEKLSLRATHTFDEVSLSDVALWVREKTGLNVILDERSLETVSILPSEPVTDVLVDAPIYQLLDRLERIGVGWNLQQDVLYFHAVNEPSAVYTIQYNVGDLLDQKFKADELMDALLATAIPVEDAEDEGGGPSEQTTVLLGDVLFVRQKSRTHRRIAGVLAALRKPARRVMVDDPREHIPLRSALDQTSTVQFKDVSLSAVIESLATNAKVDIRLDRIALKGAKLSDRVPVSLEIREQSLRTILDLLTSQQRLAWLIRDGVLWITTPEIVEATTKIAVFDVRDLCVNRFESESLQNAIEQQSNPVTWQGGGGEGVIAFPKSGIMLVTQTESGLNAVLQLLEDYRLALRNSKRRMSPEDDPEVVETKYYRMPTEVATDLEMTLPTLVATDSWWSPKNPTAVGKIVKIRSWNERALATSEDGKQLVQFDSYSVLVISQKRKVHKEIPKVLDQIEHGDSINEGMGGMGGMGGFGGGMFSITEDDPNKDRR